MLSKIFTIITILLLSCNYCFATTKDSDNELVILLHGIAKSSKHMKKLELYLEKQNFKVININYPSTEHPLNKLAVIIHNKIKPHINLAQKVNFVGYSLGGVMVRILLAKYNYENLGRVVQLAPPNRGSKVADHLQNNWLFKKIYGPAGQQLITNQAKIKHLFKEINYEVGIIAGNKSIDPISSLFFIKGKDDGKVSIKNTKLDKMTDHIVVPASHIFFPAKKIVHKQTVFFLKNGYFMREE